MGKDTIVRVIPRLDIKGPNLVKGIHLEGLRVLGKPDFFAEHYYQQGADELIYQDVVASLYERNSLHDIISRTAKKIFIPLTVGGGLRTIEDIKRVLRAGADKVSLNTAAINNPDFVKKAAVQFGSSTISIAIEAIKESDGRYLAYTDNAREYTGVEVIAWAKRVEELGAGEILLTSVDQEGTGEGYDLALIEQVKKAVGIPVIALGGMGTPDHGTQAVQAGADAIAMASVLHYNAIEKYKDLSIGNEEEGNITFLKSGKRFSKIQPCTLPDIKANLLENKIRCRNYQMEKALV